MRYLPRQTPNFDLSRHYDYVDSIRQLTGGDITAPSQDVTTDDYHIAVCRFDNYIGAIPRLCLVRDKFPVMAIYGAKPNIFTIEALRKYGISVIWRINGVWQNGR